MKVNLSFIVFSTFSQTPGQIRQVHTEWLYNSNGELGACYNDNSAGNEVHYQEQQNEEDRSQFAGTSIYCVKVVVTGYQRDAT